MQSKPIRELARPSDFKNWRREFRLGMGVLTSRVVQQKCLSNDLVDWMAVVAVEPFIARNLQASGVNAHQLIAKDLSKLLQSKIMVSKKNFYEEPPKAFLLNRSDAMVPKNKIIRYEGFRSICPVTSQPDWANIYIH